MAENGIIIAIDGHSGCGKSTTAKAVAKVLGYTYIDTGAMYRAVTLYFMRDNVSVENAKAVAQALAEIRIDFKTDTVAQTRMTYLNGENVENEIRQMEVSQHVSEVSALPVVRQTMVAQQRQMARQGSVVMDGRDIGTYVFPDAALKVFMTARPAVRAQRRMAELTAKGEHVDLAAIRQNLETRDQIDSTRQKNPLKKAEDAIEIDTSDLTFGQQVKQVLSLVQKLTD